MAELAERILNWGGGGATKGARGGEVGGGLGDFEKKFFDAFFA